ncbi:MAG: biotin--[Lachnospiraceae bacterium]|nr:biotin--[acetyl-CoA-carboxylase] ligase [Lachnospiraceae bacterium]
MNTDLERENFAKSIKTDLMGQSLYYYDVIDSTNLEAKRMAAQGAKDGSVFVADAQTAGRGRRGRSWESPAGANLYFTLLLRPKIAPDKASMMTLVMALAVAQGIQATVANADPQPGIKWPNDIVLDGRKVC